MESHEPPPPLSVAAHPTRDELGHNPLTEREREILQRATDGSTVAAMALALSLSDGAIRTHLEQAYAKLGVTSRREAVARGLRNGWII